MNCEFTIYSLPLIINKMKPNIIKDKSFAFALRIIKLYKYLQSEQKEYVLSKQVLRSGTAIGALVRESEHAESKADFVHKLAIAQKECGETAYWLDLLHQSEYLPNEAYHSIIQDQQEIAKILASIIITSKKRK